MKYDPEKHHRRSIRLREYDYSQPGAYFITVVTQDRRCLFGEVVNGQMRLNEVGHMVRREWANLSNRFPNIHLDAFIIMPNHVHVIIIITDVKPVGAGLVPAHNGATTRVAPTDATDAHNGVAPTVGDIVGAFKSITTVQYTYGVKYCGWPPFRGRLWQRNYYEHIIRNEKSLNRVREYILNNPLRWETDRESQRAPCGIPPKDKP
ncbi:MAG: hypothetical protein QHJ34_13500 [bacterium]|jgi:REP element-mobilizing transposase RayT|nr:hypothetical protein [candidate division KSB1 bacterium]MDH7561227.1 hypothetical protein [bacterium]